MRSINTTYKTIYQLSLQSCRKVKQNDKMVQYKKGNPTLAKVQLTAQLFFTTNS